MRSASISIRAEMFIRSLPGPSEMTVEASVHPRRQVNTDKLLMNLGANNPHFFSPPEMKEMLLWAAGLMSRRERGLTYGYFLEHRLAIIPQLVGSLDLATQDIYRGISWLEEHGFLLRFGKIRVGKPGARPVLYGLPCVTDEEVARASLEAQKVYTPAYAAVDRLVQIIWEDVRDEEIQYRKILEAARKNSGGLYIPDIANMTAAELARKGVKVWR